MEEHETDARLIVIDYSMYEPTEALTRMQKALAPSGEDAYGVWQIAFDQQMTERAVRNILNNRFRSQNMVYGSTGQRINYNVSFERRQDGKLYATISATRRRRWLH